MPFNCLPVVPDCTTCAMCDASDTGKISWNRLPRSWRGHWWSRREPKMVSQMALPPSTVREGAPREGLVARSALPLPLHWLLCSTIQFSVSSALSSTPFRPCLPPVLLLLVCIEPLRQGHFHASVLPCSKNLLVEQLDACEVHVNPGLCRSILPGPDTCCCLCRVM